MKATMERGEDAGRTALTFTLEGERFALPVERVHEIIDPLPVTLAPGADPFAPGLINVRGVVAPLLDLRRRLGMGPAALSETSRMLVLDLELDGEPVKVAALADAVDEIVELGAIEPVPELGVRWPPELIGGVAKQDGGLVILLDVETAFAPRPPAAPTR